MTTSNQDLAKFYEAALRNDPLFGPIERDFEPTIHQLIEHVMINEQPYDPPGRRQRVNFSLRPDLITQLQTIATDFDMNTSTTVDALLRVALGDYAEWWNLNGPRDTTTDQEGK